ncbi:MAG: ChbG/HpnK family deacetylase [Alphaproteobacteria bacterium]|nr:ChbG/HpnK family deacetylase [Alphaproteobacteria bacterium]
MHLRYILHADDIGLTAGITRSIVRAVDVGHVRSVSLIVNGWGLDEAVEALVARPELRVSIHLNLLEGVPLAGAGAVPLLVGEDGRLAATFQKLSRKWALGGKLGREELNRQIGLEFRAQIARGCEVLGTRLDRLRVDSHTHIHALPFVLDTLLEADLPRRVEAVRLPREVWHISPDKRDRSTMFGANLVKHGLLNRLSVGIKAKLDARGIDSNPLMLGVLHTGAMTVSAIAAGIEASERFAGGRRGGAQVGANGEPVEVLLHPGRAEEGEQDHWAGRPDLWAYYSSMARSREFDASQASELSSLLGSGETQ